MLHKPLPGKAWPSNERLPKRVGRPERKRDKTITLPNLDLAHQQLSARGVAVTQPHQFRDIAYMSHTTDPEGYIIELIQHTFEGKLRTDDGLASRPMGGGAQIGLVTLRISDINADLAKCRDELGMSYLSRQAVTDLGFDLYFLALTEEHPPNLDVKSIENREWLWQRPYTVLEFQHRVDGVAISDPGKDADGGARILINTVGADRVIFT